MENRILVFVLGAPGAGKGTQCALIEKEFGWAHISAGDLLRQQVAEGTEAGLQAQEYMREGKMVPASMIIGLLKGAMDAGKYTKVLIDGFPRKVDQLREFEETVQPCATALFYNVAEETARERLNQRSESSGRVDDNEETIHKRFVVFTEESMPVIDALRAEGRVAEIDAGSGSPEQVFAATKQVIQQLEQQQRQAQQVQEQAAAVETAEPQAAAAEVAAAAEEPAAEAAPAAEEQAAVEATAAEGITEAAEGSSAAEPVLAAAAVVAAAAAGGGTAVAAADASEEKQEPAVAAVELEPATTVQESSAVEPAATEPPVVPAAEAAAAAAEVPSAEAPAAAVPVIAAETPVAEPLVAPAAAEAEAVVAATDAAAEAPAPAVEATPGPVPAAAAAPAGVALQMDLSGIRTPIVICGPSGVGKGTLISKLMAQYPDHFGFSVSHTTRGPRPGEQHGVHYYFSEPSAMRSQIEQGLFLEHAEVHGNTYGTSLAAVARVSSEGKHCVLDIDVQGAVQVRASALGPQCLFIFVAPPSHEELERRLRNRGTEAEDKVLQRLANAESEIAKAQEPGLFNHILVNADLEMAYYELQQLIRQRVPGLLPEPVQPAAAAAAASAAPALAAAAAAATPVVLTNGNITGGVLPQATVAAAAAGGTSTLLDFGFGASAGPAVAAKGMPVRQYMDVTVIPVLREGLKALNAARPDDPLQYLADYLVAHKPLAH